MGKRITVIPLGGKPQQFAELRTVRDAKEAVDLPLYTAVVNNMSAGNDEPLADGSTVDLAPPVKGGLV